MSVKWNREHLEYRRAYYKKWRRENREKCNRLNKKYMDRYRFLFYLHKALNMVKQEPPEFTIPSKD